MRTKPIKRSKHHKWKTSLRGPKMNWEIVASNLAEADGDIRQILKNIGDTEVGVGFFKVQIEHILHHILTAWNARHMDSDKYFPDFPSVAACDTRG